MPHSDSDLDAAFERALALTWTGRPRPANDSYLTAGTAPWDADFQDCCGALFFLLQDMGGSPVPETTPPGAAIWGLGERFPLHRARLRQLKGKTTFDYLANTTSAPEEVMRTVVQIDQGMKRRFMPLEAAVETDEPGEPRETTKNRAALYKSIKDGHANWSYAQVAIAANRQEDTDRHTEETVRNTYRAMRKFYGEEWNWERADRVR